MIWEHFWIGVGFIYLALVFLALDIWLEPDLKLYPRPRIFIVSSMAALTLLFTFTWVLVSSPIEIQVVDSIRIADEESRICDIKWKSDYHETSVFIENHTGNDYSNLVISVSTNLNIAHIGRCGKCLDGSVEQGIQMGPMQVRGPNGLAEQKNAEGPVNIPVPGTNITARSFGSYSPVWVIRCDKIMMNDTIELVLAVVHLDKGFNLLSPQKPSWVQVNIDYESMGHRRRRIERKIVINDPPPL